MIVEIFKKYLGILKCKLNIHKPCQVFYSSIKATKRKGHFNRKGKSKRVQYKNLIYKEVRCCRCNKLLVSRRKIE